MTKNEIAKQTTGRKEYVLQAIDHLVHDGTVTTETVNGKTVYILALDPNANR